ncbi:MAG TPA: cupin domain-containing protein [Terriglobales bacterium]|nr:cupin domain-containing protein [Terriglobales bacterium]
MSVTMAPVKAADRLVANIKSAPFKPFETDGAVIPGQSYLQFDETFEAGTGFHVYRMAPGTASQPHEHTCHESFYVVEGEIIDHDGYVYRAGDFVLLKAGTIHNTRTETGATLIVFIRSMERNL